MRLQLQILSLFLISCSNIVESNTTNCDSNLKDCAGVCNGSAVEDCTGVCEGSVAVDCAGICGGNATDCTVQLELFLNDNGGLDINYYSSAIIYGFQFNINGISITDANGGDAEAAGLTVSTSSFVVLGFSFSQLFVPSGSGVLTTLSFVGSGDVCIVNPIFSDISGGSLAVDVAGCINVDG